MLSRILGTLSLHEEPFFQDIDPDVISRIENFAYHRRFDPRQIIFFPNDPCDYIYWIREGRVRVTRPIGEGREFTFTHLFPGDMLGYCGLGQEASFQNLAEAVEDSVLCLIRRDDFLRLLKSETAFSQRILQYLFIEVSTLENILVDTVSKTVRSRVAGGILRLCHDTNGDAPDFIMVTHQEIANLVGATRETTTLVLHALQKEGLIKLSNRRITLLDTMTLNVIAQQH